MHVRWSIHAWLFVLVLAVAVPLIALVAYTSYIQRQEQTTEAYARTLSLAHLSSAKTLQFIDESHQTMAVIAQRPAIRAADPAACDPILGEFQSINPLFANIGVVNLEGQVICSAVVQPGGRFASVADTDWFQHVVRTGSATVGRPFVGPITGKWVSVLAHPLTDAHGRMLGVLALPIDLARYQVALDAVALPDQTVITMIDANGTVVARSHEAESWVGKNIGNSAIARDALARHEGQIRDVGPDGIERIYGYTTIPQVGWHIFVGTPTDVVLADVRAATARNGVLSLLLIVLVAAVAAALGRRIARPIHALAAATEAATRGRLDMRAPVYGPAEIADVAERFNALVAGRAAVETVLRQSEQALRDSESRFRRLAEHLPQMVWTAKPDGSIDYLSLQWFGYTGAPPETLLGNGWMALVHPQDQEAVARFWRVALADGGQPAQAEFRIRRHDGTYRWFDTRVEPLHDDAGRLVQWVGSNTNTDEARVLREALHTSNRALRMLSDCNQLLIRTADEPTLLAHICRTIVEIGGYQLAWVGYAEHDLERSVCVAATYGHDDGYLSTAQVSWADTERGRGPTGTAIRTGIPAIARDLAREPNFAPWRATARARGYGSSISLPLVIADTTIGALNIYASQPDAFDPAEMALLLELADDLSFGITTLRTRDAHAQTQQALARSEDRFARIFQLSPSAVAIVRLRDWMLLDVNDGAALMFGIRRAELIGKPASELWHYDDGEGQRTAIIQQLQSQGRVRDHEIRMRTTAGRVVTVLFSIELIELDGEACAIVIAHDISERKRAEQAVRQSERKYAALVAHTWVAIALMSPEGQILYASPTTPRMLGYAPAELAQFNALDLVHPDDRDEAAARLEMALRQPGEVVQVTVRLRNNTGQWRYIEATLTNMIDDPVIGAIVNNYRDITEQRKLQEQFLQAQKMESVGRLAGGVAHDFNNLLTAIAGYAELALEELAPDSLAARDVHEIVNTTQRASSLTRQLLAFAREQVIEPRVLDLNVLVQDLEKLLRRLIGEDIELVTATTQDLHPIKADPGQIEQILLNMVVNARDAMPGGGVLVIETGNIVLDEDDARRLGGMQPGQYVLLTVSDTGIGIGEETQQHIFEPFFTTKAAGQGTGLGLATCYGIVQQHGGTIAVYSEAGHGTSFQIFLPAIGGSIDEPARLPAAPASLAGHETVLLVEDEPTVREIAARILREYGYTVIEAGDGEEALRLIDHGNLPIDLLVTDVIMPKIQGGSLAERVSAIYPCVRVVFMSGYTDGMLVDRQDLLARSAYLQKPFSPGALARKVREVLDAHDTPV